MSAVTTTRARTAPLGNTTVADIMTRDVVSVSPATGFKEIVELLETHHISAVPVVDGGALVGIVSEGDLLLKEEGVRTRLPLLMEGTRHRERRLKADGVIAEELMTCPAVSIAPQASLPEAARLMDAHRIKRLPVVDGDALVGICSRADVLKVFLEDDESIKRRVVDGIVVGWMSLEPDAIDVVVEGGVVTLRGLVERRSDAEILVRLTSTLEPVVRVVDDLTWQLDDHKPLAAGGARFE